MALVGVFVLTAWIHRDELYHRSCFRPSDANPVVIGEKYCAAECPCTQQLPIFVPTGTAFEVSRALQMKPR